MSKRPDNDVVILEDWRILTHFMIYWNHRSLIKSNGETNTRLWPLRFQSHCNLQAKKERVYLYCYCKAWVWFLSLVSWAAFQRTVRCDHQIRRWTTYTTWFWSGNTDLYCVGLSNLTNFIVTFDVVLKFDITHNA